MDAYRFCPRCAAPLTEQPRDGRTRSLCTADGCGFIHYNNPLPVVAAVVELDGQVILARQHGWPEKFYGLITGFLEAGESPQEGILRELDEELGLSGRVESLIGVYPFTMRNEVIMAFHVVAQGTIRLGEELAGIKSVAPEKLRPWPMGTGQAVADWLARRPVRG